jgi:hypothetical protein
MSKKVCHHCGSEVVRTEKSVRRAIGRSRRMRCRACLKSWRTLEISYSTLREIRIGNADALRALDRALIADAVQGLRDSEDEDLRTREATA